MEDNQDNQVNFNDLMEMTLKEVLDKFCAVMSPECGYYYGIFKYEDVEEIYNEYNIDEEYPEAFYPEPLINEELMDCENPVGDYAKLERIMDNLGINKKTKLKRED